MLLLYYPGAEHYIFVHQVVMTADNNFQGTAVISLFPKCFLLFQQTMLVNAVSILILICQDSVKIVSVSNSQLWQIKILLSFLLFCSGLATQHIFGSGLATLWIHKMCICNEKHSFHMMTQVCFHSQWLKQLLLGILQLVFLFKARGDTNCTFCTKIRWVQFLCLHPAFDPSRLQRLHYPALASTTSFTLLSSFHKYLNRFFLLITSLQQQLLHAWSVVSDLFHISQAL